VKASILNKLETLCDRHEEISGLLSEPEVIKDQNQFRKLSVEYGQLEPVVQTFTEYKQYLEDKEAAEEMLSDPEMKEMAQDEIKEIKPKLDALELELQKLLLPKDPNDD
jgi:peptide chain release factor 1